MSDRTSHPSTASGLAPDGAAVLARALNDAGLAIFRASATGDGAISPLSIGLALGMVRAGASGSVAASLDALFDYPAQGDTLLAQFDALRRAASSEGESTVRIANGAFVDTRWEPSAAWGAAVTDAFGAEARRLPLRDDPDGSRNEINAWVCERTGGLIRDSVPDGVPTPDTALMLANAIYLKAEWEATFDASSTEVEDFHRLDGTVREAQMMGSLRPAIYAHGEGFSAVTLPYLGDLEMVLIVPESGRFETVREQLDQRALDALDASWQHGLVSLALPRFESQTSVPLREAIEDHLGIAGLFDVVGLDGIGPDLAISAALHATRVRVDEEGTEAAAVTLVGIEMTGLPPEPDATVHADRPFLYVIREVQTGAIAFVGQVTDPVAPIE